MSEPKKRNRSKSAKTKPATDQKMLGDLAESILAMSNKDLLKEVDPFEIYTCHLKMRLYPDPKVFRKRFIAGYEALLSSV